MSTDLPDNMTPVVAAGSHIHSAGHDGSHLFVKYKTGPNVIYKFLGVPDHHHAAILGHASPGSYLHQHINGKFKHERIEL